MSSTEIMISILLQRLLSFNSLAIRDGEEKLLRHVGTQLTHSAARLSATKREKKRNKTEGEKNKLKVFSCGQRSPFRVSA